MKFLQALIITWLIFFVQGCISAKKYNNAIIKLREQDSLLNALRIDTSNLYQSLIAIDNKNFKLAQEINSLKFLIEKHSNTSPNNNISFIPTIPIPPPQPTNHYVFTEKTLKKYKKYSQIDSLISRSFQINNYNKLYLAVENGGFAVATNFEEIDKNGNRINLGELRNSFSIVDFLQKKMSDVFFSKTGYFRCIVIVVSPNLSQLGGASMSYDEIDSWLKAKTIRLPDHIVKTKIDKSLQMVALLYEFQQNENTDNKVQIIKEGDSKTNLSKNPLIKTIQNGN